MTHGELIDAIIQAVSDAGIARLFRNPSGRATHKKNGKTWVVPYGVGPRGGGGHDLIGWRMDGRFLSFDAKVGRDFMSDDQLKWQRWVIAGGGIAGEVRSVQDALDMITEHGKWVAPKNPI